MIVFYWQALAIRYVASRTRVVSGAVAPAVTAFNWLVVTVDFSVEVAPSVRR